MAWHERRFTPRPGKFEQACAECGRTMYLPQSKLREYQRCGPACNAAWRARRKRDRQRECATCQAVFLPRTTQVAAGGGRFCSQACNTAFRNAGNSPTARARAVVTFRTNRAKRALHG